MRKKKLAVTLMCAALGISMISGCGSKENNSDNKKTTQAEKETTKESSDSKSSENETETDAPIGDESKLKDLPQYKGLKVKKSTDEITDEELSQQLDYFKSQYPNKITSGKVKDKDTVNIDYVGKVDGKEFDGGSATGYDLTIGSGAFIDGFESSLIGKKIGEKCTIDVTFPEDYQSTDLAGKPAQFDVTINYVKDTSFEIDKDFIEEHFAYSHTDNLDDFKKWVKKKMRFNAVYQDVWGDYLDSCEMESYAKKDIEDAKDTVATQYENNIKNQYGMTKDEYMEQASMSEDDWNYQLEAGAKSTIKMKLIIETIADKEKLEVSDDQYNEYLQDGAKQLNMTTEEYEEEYGKDTIKQQILSENVLNFVTDNAKVVPDEELETTTEAATTEKTTTSK